MPFIAGNLIYSIRIPVNIGRAASIAIIALACLQLRRWSPFSNPILKRALTLLIITGATTLIGVILAMQFSDTLEMWSQSPAERALRAGLRYGIFWLLPIAIGMFVRSSKESRILLRDFIRAGIFYTVLGILQLGVGQVFGVDLFPIIRNSGEGSVLLQHMVGDNAVGRITSICGEPRYFSSFLTIWLVFTISCGPLAGLRSWQIRTLSLLFLVTNILTGSRTGLAQLALILALLLIVCLVQQERKLVRRTWEIVLFALAGFLVIALVQGLVLRGRIGIGEDSANDHVEIMGFSLPIEFQDSQPAVLFIEKPFGLVTGFGAGLWQYETDPYASELFRRYFFDQGVQSLDSQRQNITALAFLVDFGLLGIWLAFRFYQFCLGFAERRGGLVLRREFKPVVSVLVVATAIGAVTDIYSNVMVFLVLTLWIQTAAERKSAARAIDATWKQPEAYTYNT
jgi:hypothetical protein